MKVLIFKTNVATDEQATRLTPLFEHDPDVSRWTVDTEDVDKVLRIVSAGRLDESEVIRLVSAAGFHCEILPD